MAEPSENLVEETKNEKESKVPTSVEQLGDVGGFVRAAAYYGAAVLIIGYVGATIINITNLSGKEIDDLFPTNLQSFPYQVPVGKTNSSGDSIEMLFNDYHATLDAESLTRATLEFIFPMKRLSFPYTSWFLSKEFEGTKGYILAKWFACTCAGTFCAWRKLYKILIVIGKWFHTVAYNVSDLFLFYVFPYIIIYLVALPFIPILGAGLAMLSSTMYNIPGAWILTFSPFMGGLLAISNILAGGFFNIFSWIMAGIIFGFGFCLGWVNVMWWFMIGFALWLYTAAFLVLSPLLHKGGIQNVVDEFIRHKKSLLTVFTILIVVAAFANLSTALSTGFTIGALLCFYLIYKLPAPETKIKT